MTSSTAIAPGRTIPGPPARGLGGNIREFGADRLGFLARLASDHGDVVGFRLAHRRMVLVNHPDLVEEVLVARNRQFIKHFALRMARPTLGNGLLTSEGDFWRRQRRLSQPAFHRERIAAHGAVMVGLADRMVDGWADDQDRDVHDDLMRVTLEIVAKTLFDADVSGDAAGAAEAMETLVRSFTARVGQLLPLPTWIPTPINLRFRRAKNRLDRIVYRMIADRRGDAAGRGDLLSMLIHAADADVDGEGDDDGKAGPPGMTDLQLRDEAMTLFLAGHETTANTLAWAFYLLSQHPDAEARLHAELDAVLGDRPPAFADLPRLPWAEHVINETLRLYPTVWLLGREAVEPTEVGGHPIAKGTTVYMSQWVVHRDPRFFDDPLAYRPERWEGGLARRLPRYAFFPFGGGPRICIGNNFAMMEAVLLLATIARRYRVRVPRPDLVRPIPTMTLRPDGGIPARVEVRR